MTLTLDLKTLFTVTANLFTKGTLLAKYEPCKTKRGNIIFLNTQYLLFCYDLSLHLKTRFKVTAHSLPNCTVFI